MTPQYIMRKSLCRAPSCANEPGWRRTAERYIENLQGAHEYAEPGYKNPKHGILFSNWNYFPRDLSSILERAGYEIEWEDEWTICNGCGNALRISPDSHSWQPSYLQNNDECYCLECLTEDDIATLENTPKRAINLSNIDLSKYGYRELKCGYESGWHPGQNDDPEKIYNEFIAHGHKRLLFQINQVGQFDCSFCIWEKKTQMKRRYKSCLTMTEQ
jgi:hypothetical protein